MGDMSFAPTLEMSNLFTKFGSLLFYLFAAMACARSSVVQLDMGLESDQSWIRIQTWIELGFKCDSIVQWVARWILCFFVLGRPGSRMDPVRGGLLDGAVPIEPRI